MSHKFVRLLSFVAVILLIFLGNNPPRAAFEVNWTKELEALTIQGFTHRFLDPELIELEESMSGRKNMKTIQKRDINAIQEWTGQNSIPFLEIDPGTIDTGRYTGWYKYWTSVPLSNGISAPDVVGDVDHNGRPEVYGVFKDTLTGPLTRIYEVDTTGSILLRAEITPRHGAAEQITDVDNNGLLEVKYQLGDSAFFDEQPSPDSVPFKRKIAHAMYESCGAIFTYEPVSDMDADSLIDFVYRGSEPDTECTHYNTYIAEYDPGIENFRKVWHQQLWPPNREAGIGGYDIGDYDSDGRANFLASGMYGQIWMLESDSDNHYSISWKDSTPFVNLLYQTSGDVDGNGKREFFVSATMSNGNWTAVYEADSNNHYSPKFLFHLLSGGSLDEPTLLTNDVDGDFKPEFIILSGADLFIFKSSTENSYALWYYKRFELRHSIQFYNFNGEGKKDFIMSKGFVNNQGLLKYSSDIYLADAIAGFDDKSNEIFPRRCDLAQNYPNPFNPNTSIGFSLSRQTIAILNIYDLTGKRIATLMDRELPAGKHTVRWNAASYTSGVYFYRLTTNEGTLTKRMLLLK